ncbi:uncharacterized protein BCR38DRAFT_217127 [Pseudomassariella vexata]|uniref:Zinc knuckle CX2CX3GHX4C domain-containing protein n=1 Tax=Pseudomassariella vexata TaxID=1141098 RepID=A0A1Y2DUD3_9PEZI|nr:uncharacterized protein BCR38DRAFT_217127 [Pseudomassariella vexata]ORY62902.1 hypothetical protein BCR38DRAFT_217127 [Pseudomassariella vexata]
MQSRRQDSRFGNIDIANNLVLGHYIWHCPTNMDPSYDRLPDHDYVCGFCGQMGHHLATLCPRNDQPWSLTHQRKDVGIQMKSMSDQWKASPQRAGRLPANYDTYRPDDFSSPRHRSDMADGQLRDRRDSQTTFTLPLRDRTNSPLRAKRARENSPKPPYRSLPLRTRLGYTPEAVRQHTDRYRPNLSRNKPFKAGGSGPTIFKENKTEGRLSYHDEDVFMSTGSPLATPSNATSNPRSSDRSNHAESLKGTPTRLNEKSGIKMSSTTGLNEAFGSKINEPIGAVADEFLSLLGIQFQNDENNDEVASTPESDVLIQDVASEPHTENDADGVSISESTLQHGPDGKPCRLVTKPNFRDEVVRLFQRHPNPIVTELKRPRAVDVWEEAEKSVWSSTSGPTGRSMPRSPTVLQTNWRGSSFVSSD